MTTTAEQPPPTPPEPNRNVTVVSTTGFAQPTDRLASETAGATISPRLAKVMVALFLLIIATPAVVQFFVDATSGERSQLLNLFGQRPTAKSLEQFSESLARESWLTQTIRAAGEINGTPDFTNSGVTPGTDGFLFLRSEIDFVSGAGFLDPQFPNADQIVPTIVDFDRQLKKLGIHLVVLPVPAKVSIYPEKVFLPTGPALNADWSKWLATLRSSGVDVFDLTGVFWQAKQEKPDEPVFLGTDTHWSPRGFELAADKLAPHVRPMLGDYQSLTFTTTTHDQEIFGDLARLANVRFNAAYPGGKKVLTVPLLDGKPVAAALPKSPVLLIGDSYSWNMMDRGGFGQQLMMRLGTGVQTVADRGGNCLNTMRKKLADEPALLAGRKVLIWEFGARFLREIEQWERYELSPPPPADQPASTP